MKDLFIKLFKMTDKQTILEFIKKTGFSFRVEACFYFDSYEALSLEKGFLMVRYHESEVDGSIHINEIIFNRDCAKAFYVEDWEYHLQQQVIADDPIDYIRQYLNK